MQETSRNEIYITNTGKHVCYNHDQQAEMCYLHSLQMDQFVNVWCRLGMGLAVTGSKVDLFRVDNSHCLRELKQTT